MSKPDVCKATVPLHRLTQLMDHASLDTAIVETKNDLPLVIETIA